MISEHVAVGRPGALRTRRSPSPWRIHLTARPALAGRERLAQALGQSVLVQLMLAMCFVALAALLYMAQAGQVSVQQININTLRSDRMMLVATNTNYRAIATTLRSTERIDATATQQLHMAPQTPGSTVWIYPVIPRVPAIAPINADASAAQHASQPLAWMQRAIQFVQSSL